MRRSSAKIRDVAVDVMYGDAMVTRMIRVVMLKGKKSIAERIVYGALDTIGKKMKLRDDAAVLTAFLKAVDNVRPSVEVKSRRVGGATYPVPVAVPDRKSIFRSLTWIVLSARKRSGSAMITRLADELLDAYNGKGSAIKKRDDMHKMAEANKAFAQYSF